VVLRQAGAHLSGTFEQPLRDALQFLHDSAVLHLENRNGAKSRYLVLQEAYGVLVLLFAQNVQRCPRRPGDEH